MIEINIFVILYQSQNWSNVFETFQTCIKVFLTLFEYFKRNTLPFYSFQYFVPSQGKHYEKNYLSLVPTQKKVIFVVVIVIF